jgi:site-specific recombinase XerD
LVALSGGDAGQRPRFSPPLSVESADNALRLLARWLLDRTDVRTVTEISRDDIEDFKVAVAQRRGIKGQALAANTQRQRLRMLRMFFERIIEWDWPDAPIRNPIIDGDIPPRPEPLPKFLDDRDAAKVMAAARAASDPRDRLVVEVLARTGLRASELRDLDVAAGFRSFTNYRLRSAGS